jgi:DNA topoisomerase-1
MNLVIVESPAKCKKIASFLGPTFRVLATMGHIRTLEQDLDAIGLDSDFTLRYTFMKEKASTMNAIKEAAKTAKTVYLCADDDREGEAIAYSVACLLKKDPLSFPRSVFHEITESAVKRAIAQPRKIDMDKVYAQQARSVLDMMIGFTISPLLWKFVARGLSAGRCQTPALRLVYEREAAIESHVASMGWVLTADLGSMRGTMEDELSDEESALNYLENVHTSNVATVVSVKDSTWSASAPKPLITSTLQQEVSAAYGINPKDTMKIAQKLYEAGHITYMRTDSAIMSTEAVQAAHIWVREAYGEKYIGSGESGKPTASKKSTPDSGQNAQEAHEAIRPTHMDHKELVGEYTALEKKVYAFIWKRSMQSTMSPATGVKRVVKFRLDSDPDAFAWSTSRSKTLFQGWQILGKQVDIDADSATEADTEAFDLDSMKEGQKIQWKNLTAAPKHSSPSPRFTQATLVRELETCGIGRPSTFASLIDVLLSREYVEVYDNPGSVQSFVVHTIAPLTWPPLAVSKERKIGVDKKKLKPTALGKSVLDMCLKDFSGLFDYSFTSTMEKRLDLVAEGKDSWKKVCSDIWTSYKDIYLRLRSSDSAPQKSEKVCELGEGYKAVVTKKGVPLLIVNSVFTPLPEGTKIQDLTLEDAKRLCAEHAANLRLGSYDGVDILKKKGPHGEYVQWKEVRVPLIEGETIDKTVERLKGKSVSAPQKIVGDFVFAVGQYGPYMYKKSLQKKTFVSIPSVDVSTLTPAAAKELYAKGLATKKMKGQRPL